MSRDSHVLSTPLTKSQVSQAKKLRFYLLAQDLIAQHPEDGGVVIPAGRMIHTLQDRSPDSEYTYVASEMYVVSPGTVDIRSGLPEDVVRIKASRKRPIRFLVLPEGKECAYLRQIGLMSS